MLDKDEQRVVEQYLGLREGAVNAYSEYVDAFTFGDFYDLLGSEIRTRTGIYDPSKRIFILAGSGAVLVGGVLGNLFNVMSDAADTTCKIVGVGVLLYEGISALRPVLENKLAKVKSEILQALPEEAFIRTDISDDFEP